MPIFKVIWASPRPLFSRLSHFLSTVSYLDVQKKVPCHLNELVMHAWLGLEESRAAKKVFLWSKIPKWDATTVARVLNSSERAPTATLGVRRDWSTQKTWVHLNARRFLTCPQIGLAGFSRAKELMLC